MSATDRNRLVPGLAAVLLFGAMAVAFLNAEFGAPEGFPEGESIIHNIGYAMFNLDLGAIPSEGFLAAFLIIALALDVAIDASIYLAKREEEGRVVSAVGGAFTGHKSDRSTGGED